MAKAFIEIEIEAEVDSSTKMVSDDAVQGGKYLPETTYESTGPYSFGGERKLSWEEVVEIFGWETAQQIDEDLCDHERARWV